MSKSNGSTMSRSMKAGVLKAKAYKKKANRGHKMKAKGRDLLELYYRDVEAQGLLTREQEISLATKMWNAEIEAWKLILGDSPWRRIGIAMIMSPRKGTRDEGYPKTPKKGWSSLEAEAKRLRTIDHDRRILKQVIDGAPPEIAKEARAKYSIGSAVRETFAASNLRLVVSMASRFTNRGMQHGDLIQEGNIGLMIAIGRFDPERNLRFSTYACWWIRHALGRAVSDQSRTVRIPVHLLDDVTKAAKFKRKLLSELGRDPSAEELSEASGLTLSKLEVVRHVHADTWSLSLDYEVPGTGDGDGAMFHEFLADDRIESTDATMGILQLQEEAKRLLGRLTPVEADVLRNRFGISDHGDGVTLREVGQKYGVSRERIRQIQGTALDKLRRWMGRKIEEVGTL